MRVVEELRVASREFRKNRNVVMVQKQVVSESFAKEIPDTLQENLDDKEHQKMTIDLARRLDADTRAIHPSNKTPETNCSSPPSTLHAKLGRKSRVA